MSSVVSIRSYIHKANTMILNDDIVLKFLPPENDAQLTTLKFSAGVLNLYNLCSKILLL